MPAPSRTPIRTTLPPFQLNVHTTATDLLHATLPTLSRHERSANIILAHAFKIRDEELSGRPPHTQYPRVWISLWSTGASPLSPSTPSSLIANASATVRRGPQLEMVLSCCDWTLGTYPIFIWTAASPASLSSSFLVPRIEALAHRLRQLVPDERVYSVFAATPVTKVFTSFWTKLSGAQPIPDPFYSASYSFCTKETVTSEHKGPLPAGHTLRRAEPEDVYAVAQNCQLFADDSVYFIMSNEDALIEAHELIAKRVVWVYEVVAPDADGVPQISIACICAVTRTTRNVAAITKVFTHPLFRQRGCAERLVRHVTHELLEQHDRQMVVLYVGHTNSAARVYDRVGFVGLSGKPKVDGVEDWLELGFANTDRGHW
ncbi:hypothetical protein AURDEDRAFT_110076 [Auricularia subglabra TFB-10046 SS5]|nr:hypothetical protein AURDEDRAFT_110076 [Auricularia subglabra TFB-10046 SS5]